MLHQLLSAGQDAQVRHQANYGHTHELHQQVLPSHMAMKFGGCIYRGDQMQLPGRCRAYSLPSYAIVLSTYLSVLLCLQFSLRRLRILAPEPVGQACGFPMTGF